MITISRLDDGYQMVVDDFSAGVEIGPMTLRAGLENKNSRYIHKKPR